MAISFLLLTLSHFPQVPRLLSFSVSLALFLACVASSLGSTRWTISGWPSLKNKEVGVQKGQR